MASHFLVYRCISDSKPVDCDTDPDHAKRKAAALGGAAAVSRLLTGTCPLCGRGVSRLVALAAGMDDFAETP